MSYRAIAIVWSGCLFVLAGQAAADWPQWRGLDRDAKAHDFVTPAEWPSELTKKWQVTVGDGVATPALVGDRLFAFTREEDNEVVRCLDAATGDEIWKAEYAAEAITGAASGYAGPRSSPAVAEGKVVTLGVQGVLSCFDTSTGELLWRHDEYEGAIPRFATSSSPLIVDGRCIAQLGDEENGAIVAFELTSGEQQWKWDGDGPSYGSPTLASIDGTEVLITPTDKNMVAISVADGTLLWQVPYSQGRYNAASPIIFGDNTIIYAGPTQGTSAEKLVKVSNEIATEQLWKNNDNSLIYNTPVLKEGLLFGVSNLNSLFCIKLSDGQTAWNAPLGTNEPEGERAERPRPDGDAQARDRQPAGQNGEREGDQGERRRRGGGRRGGGGRGGYGSTVDAGRVVLALTPTSELIVFEPTDEAFKQVAKFKVAESPTHAYPIVDGNRIFIKDQNSVMLWTIE